MIVLVYHFHFMPYTDRQLQKMEIFNESILLLQIYCLLSFSKGNPHIDHIKPYDLIFVTLCGTYIGIHLTFLLLDIFRSIFAKIRASLNKKKSKGNTAKK